MCYMVYALCVFSYNMCIIRLTRVCKGTIVYYCFAVSCAQLCAVVDTLTCTIITYILYSCLESVCLSGFASHMLALFLTMCSYAILYSVLEGLSCVQFCIKVTCLCVFFEFEDS